MKTKLSLFTIAFLTITVLTICLDVVNASDNGGFFIFRNNADVYYQDLDCRDENNNPVIADNSVNNLENLFISGYYELLVNAETYSFAQSLAILKKALNPSDFGFAMPLIETIKNLISVILLSIKKFVNSTPVSMPNLFSLLLSCISLFVVSTSQSNIRYSLSTVVIRC